MGYMDRAQKEGLDWRWKFAHHLERVAIKAVNQQVGAPRVRKVEGSK